MSLRWFGRRARDPDAPPRTPSLRQIQESECGVIALAIVLAHYGAWIPLMDLRRRCQLSEQGVTALSLVQAAKHYGLAVRAMRLSIDNLGLIQAPVILFWEGTHFVVLEGVRGDNYWVNDPAKGHRVISRPAFQKSYSGIALVAQPGTNFQSVGSPGRPVRAGLQMLRPGRWWLTLLAAATLAESVLLPRIVEYAGDAIRDTRSGRGADWRRGAIIMTELVAAGAARSWLTEVARDAIARPTREGLAGDSEHDVPNEMVHRPGPFMDQHSLADFPASTAVSTITAGIRMTVGVPLLVLVLGRIHPASVPVTLAAIATPILIQQRPGWVASEDQAPLDGEGGRLGRYAAVKSPVLRLLVVLSPVTVIGMLKPSDQLPGMVMALGVSGIVFHLVDSSVQSFGMLYMLPESIVQLTEFDRTRDIAQHADA